MIESSDLHQLLADSVGGWTPAPPPLAALRAVRRRRVIHRWVASMVLGLLVLAGGVWGLKLTSVFQSLRMQSAQSGHRNLPGPAYLPQRSPRMAGPPSYGVIVPNLIGLSAARAEQIASDLGLQVALGAEVVDPRPAWTVIAQSPAGGSRGTGVIVTIAVPATTACADGQLALTYLGGGAAAGNDSGGVVVRDVSSVWCTLSGPLLLVGMGPSGRPVTNTITFPVPRPLVLSPRTPVPQVGAPPPFGEVEAGASFLANLHSGPASDPLCAAGRVVPATWQVTLPGSVVLSADNYAPNDPYPGLSRFVACHGVIRVATPILLFGGGS